MREFRCNAALRAFGTVVLLAGCSSTPPTTGSDAQATAHEHCGPGTDCHCANGASGTLTCQDDRTLPGVCECPGRSVSSSMGGGGAAAMSMTASAGTGVVMPPAPVPTAGVSGGSGAIAGSGGGAVAMSAGSGGAGGSGVAGMMSSAGAGGSSAAGMGSSGTGAGGTSGTGKGMCCPDGNCLCHGDVPTQLTTNKGPYKTAEIQGSTGTIVYPTDAEPPFAALSICPGFLNTGPEMAAWGPFYASWGIVTAVTNTGAADIPDIRAQLLLGAIEEMKKMNMDSQSPLSGKLSGRYGTSGYSMGGGGTTIAASGTPSLNSSIGLAAWGGTGANTMVPTLLFCGDADVVAPCDMSTPVYGAIPMATPKMLIVVPGATHFNWFAPTDTSDQMSGKYALAFQKVYLEGDTRWKSLLLMKPMGGSVMTNIQ